MAERHKTKSLKSVGSLLSTQGNVSAVNRIEKLAQVIKRYKEKNLQKDSRAVKVENFVKFLNNFEKKVSIVNLQGKIAMKIWQIVTRKMKIQRKM